MRAMQFRTMLNLLKLRLPTGQKQIVFEAESDEKVVFEANASYLRSRIEAIGGKVFLTDKRLTFVSHKWNRIKLENSYDLNKIEGLAQSKPKHISFLYKQDRKQFIMENPTDLVDKLGL